MKKKKMMWLCAAVAVTVLVAACNVTKDLENAYNLKDCKYTYRSISNIRVNNEELGLVSGAKLLAQLSSGKSISSMPLQFTLNLNVENPNATAAAFQAMEYKVAIDSINFTEGKLMEPFSVNAGEKKTLSVGIGTDIGKLFSGPSRGAMIGIVKNLIGWESKEQSTVTVQLRPTFNVGGVPITSPLYIPVSFKIGGEKK
jgi:lipoprotein